MILIPSKEKKILSDFYSPYPEDWLDDNHLIVLKGWARDGYSLADIARQMGLSPYMLMKWRKEYPEINAAINEAREVVDYKVENSLLKAALGYSRKEVRITTIMRYGKVVETQREVFHTEVSPNISAAQFWLTNRCRGKWAKDPDKVSFTDELDDGQITISVVRAKNGSEPEDGRVVDDREVVLSKSKDKKPENNYDPSKLDVDDPDYWPEDWEDEDDENSEGDRPCV